jgi:hypothetical protein
MSWLNKHKRIWRAAIFLLLLVALIGPWSFDRIHVPRQYPCSPPNFRLEGDFCGAPLSGMWIYFWMIAGFVSILVEFATGAIPFADWAGEFLRTLFIVLILILLLTPIFSTLRLFRREGLRHNQVFHITLWGLAALFAGLYLILSGSLGYYWLLWGPWLYIGLAASALVLEAFVLVEGNKASQG